MRGAIVFTGLAFLLGSSAAFAQGQRVEVNIGGGYTVALSDVRDHLGDGYNVNFGATFNLSETIGIQGEYSFNGLGRKDVRIGLLPQPKEGGSIPTDFFADMNMQSGDVNLLFKPKTAGSARPYLVAGGGVYYRPVTVTTPGVGYIPGFCDPWWYVCYPGGFVPVENVVGQRSSTDLGMDFGGGVDFTLAENVRLYFEARYHYIWGPEVQTSVTGTDTKKANGQFLPITVGLRF